MAGVAEVPVRSERGRRWRPLTAGVRGAPRAVQERPRSLTVAATIAAGHGFVQTPPGRSTSGYRTPICARSTSSPGGTAWWNERERRRGSPRAT